MEAIQKAMAEYGWSVEDVVAAIVGREKQLVRNKLQRASNKELIELGRKAKAAAELQGGATAAKK